MRVSLGWNVSSRFAARDGAVRPVAIELETIMCGPIAFGPLTSVKFPGLASRERAVAAPRFRMNELP